MSRTGPKKEADSGTLRSAAKARLAKAALRETSGRPFEEILHELQVHQLELEIQNEALRLAKLELEESNSRYVDLYEFAPVGYLTLTAEGMIVEINLTGTKLLGSGREALLHRDFLTYIHADDSVRWEHDFLGVKAQPDGQCKMELAMLRGDGSIFHARLDCIRMPDGKVRVALSDITERVAAEVQLRKVSLAVEQSPESIVITNNNSAIEYVNEAFLQATGYCLDEVIGQTPHILHSGKTPPETYDELWKTLNQGLTWKGEFHNRRKDGSEYVEFAVITPLRQPNGSISHYVAIKEDITDKKRLAEELDQYRHHLEDVVVQRTTELLEARHQAEAANLAKSTFLANMSHEIRTPMNGILGIAYLMQRAEITPLQAQQLDKIAASGRHLLDIINDILDLSKIEAGKLILANADFVLDDLLRQISAIIDDSIGAKGLSLLIDMDNMPPLLNGDVTRLRQALVNYLSNAIKFTSHGSISLQGRVQEETEEGYLLRFAVSDNGIGIPNEHKDRIFNAFEQADKSTTRKYGGTGLGLAITQRIAHLMGGDVGFDSVPGQGSTFWLTVRMARGTQVTRSEATLLDDDAESIISNEHRGKRVLVAEDEPINQMVVSELLRHAGLEPIIAENGVQALRMAEQGHFDLILMDMQMPEMDGVESARAIRQIPGLDAVPVLAMTANAFDEYREQCMAVGMNDFITKPLDPDVLFATLLRWLKNSSHQPGLNA